MCLFVSSIELFFLIFNLFTKLSSVYSVMVQAMNDFVVLR